MLALDQWIDFARRVEAALPADAPRGGVPEAVVGYDWREAFAFAGGEGYGSADVRRCIGEPADLSAEPFGRHDVAFIVGQDEGENDGANWICFGRLWDGRWFALSAGCDYTGWDCQASGCAFVAASAEALVRLGLTDDERERLAPCAPERVAARVEPDTYM